MDIKLIFDGTATVEELQELHEKKGFEFIIEDGAVKHINK